MYRGSRAQGLNFKNMPKFDDTKSALMHRLTACEISLRFFLCPISKESNLNESVLWGYNSINLTVSVQAFLFFLVPYYLSIHFYGFHIVHLVLIIFVCCVIITLFKPKNVYGVRQGWILGLTLFAFLQQIILF